MAIKIDPSGILLEDRQLPLYSGAVHYWRHPVESWKTILENIKGCGFNILSVDTPWGVHETGPNIFDFGSHDPSKDLDSFLRLCGECSLFVIIRPGPFHNADIPGSGLPAWLTQNLSLAALTALGTPPIVDAFPYPHPIPSLASERLYQEFGKYLGMLCPTILAPHQYPQGSVILVQGGDTQGYFDRTDAYGIDYSPSSLVQYQHFLTEQYASVETINETYGTHYASISEVVPPKGSASATLENLKWTMDWVAYKEHLLEAYSRRIVTLLRNNGITVPLFQVSDSMSTPSKHHVVIEKKSEFKGIRLHPSLDQFRRYTNEIRFICGTNPLAFASDFPQGAGGFASSLASPAEQEFFILTAIMFGVSAFDFRMLAECDDWTGSPVTRSGAIRTEYGGMLRKLGDFLDAYKVLESRKVSNALVLINSAIEQYRSAATNSDWPYLDLLGVPKPKREPPPHFNFSVDPYPESISHPGTNWISELIGFLESQQVEFNLSDTNVPIGVLNKQKMVFLPTCDFIQQAVFDRLMDFVQRGGHLIMGPSQPSLNEHFQTLHLMKAVLNQFIYKYERMEAPGTVTMGNGKVTWQSDISTLRPLITKEIQNPVQLNNPNLRLTVRDGEHQLIFICNPTDQQQTTNIISTQPLKGTWNVQDATFTGIFQSVLNPISVQVWEAIS
jgi:beta-galactosidase